MINKGLLARIIFSSIGIIFGLFFSVIAIMLSLKNPYMILLSIFPAMVLITGFYTIKGNAKDVVKAWGVLLLFFSYLYMMKSVPTIQNFFLYYKIDINEKSLNSFITIFFILFGVVFIKIVKGKIRGDQAKGSTKDP